MSEYDRYTPMVEYAGELERIVTALCKGSDVQGAETFKHAHWASEMARSFQAKSVNAARDQAECFARSALRKQDQRYLNRMYSLALSEIPMRTNVEVNGSQWTPAEIEDIKSKRHPTPLVFNAMPPFCHFAFDAEPEKVEEPSLVGEIMHIEPHGGYNAGYHMVVYHHIDLIRAVRLKVGKPGAMLCSFYKSGPGKASLAEPFLPDYAQSKYQEWLREQMTWALDGLRDANTATPSARAELRQTYEDAWACVSAALVATGEEALPHFQNFL